MLHCLEIERPMSWQRVKGSFGEKELQNRRQSRVSEMYTRWHDSHRHRLGYTIDSA